jgi:uroporphyrinogen-III synthase
MDTTTHVGTHEEMTYSHMVGVFRERTKAEQALNELRQAGFQETELTVYDPHPAEEPADSSTRVLVQVLAEGREYAVHTLRETSIRSFMRRTPA